MRYRVILLYTESKMTMKLIRMQLTKRQKIVEILMHLVCQSILMDINRHTIYHIKSIFRIVIARDRSNCIFIESSSTVAKPKKITFVDERSKTSCRFEARLKPIDQPRKKQLHIRSRIQPEGEFIKLPLKFSFTRQFTSSRFLRGCTDSLRREFFPLRVSNHGSLIFHRNNPPSPRTRLHGKYSLRMDESWIAKKRNNSSRLIFNLSKSNVYFAKMRFAYKRKREREREKISRGSKTCWIIS